MKKKTAGRQVWLASFLMRKLHIFDNKAKYTSMKSHNEKVEKVTDAFNNLKEAKKSTELYSKLIDLSLIHI